MSGPQYSAFEPQFEPQTSFYQNASNFSIGTQNVTVHNGPHISSIGTNPSQVPALDAESFTVGVQLPQAIPNADHNRNRKISPPDSDCLPGTRVSLRENILSWAQSPRSSQVILWLCGSAGSGKSAVAQAVAEELDRSHRLAASFFFFRGSGERSQFARFPITLANQIASAVPGAGRYVWEAAAKLSGWSVRKQMEELVYGPIQRAFADSPREGPVVIVIDGLDECEDREGVEEFIGHLLEYFDNHPPFKFRLIISSRIEEHIQSRLETQSVQIENLANHLPDDDILTFLTVAFSRAARQSRVIRAYGAWPKNTELKTLLKHISGSFIFAATLVKFILGPSGTDGLTPMERLPLALNMNPGLDGLYTETLKRCCTFPHFTEVIAAIGLASDPMSITTLSWFLDIPSFKVLNVLLPLQAIIHVPGDDHHTPITLFHSSLRDFLVTESRSGPFFISPVHHERFAFRWLEAAPPLKPQPHIDFCPQCFVERCSTLRRAKWHWESRWGGLNPIASSFLRYINSTHGHFFHQAHRDDLALVRIAAECVPFRKLAASLPGLHRSPPPILATDIALQKALASIDLGSNLSHPPPLIYIVRCGIRFFNGQYPSNGAESTPGVYLLRHWINHLEDAVRRDNAVTLEFLQKRDYEVARVERFTEHRTASVVDFIGLKEDVLSAQNAIEDRFPGVLPKFDTTQASDLDVEATFHESTDPGRAHPKISGGGLSVLDVFNAYRTFALVEPPPFNVGDLRHEAQLSFSITFTNKLRANEYLTNEISLRATRPMPRAESYTMLSLSIT